ncbi:hypothetical protein FDECE_3637 [Fusarium decemcellulare]|nr:hypothetical protein FDECE_3637 [Fusarium decemcellulare]
MSAQNTQQEHEELEHFYLFLLRATPKNGGQERQHEGLEGLEYLEFEQLERQPSTSVEASSSGREHDDLTELDENEDGEGEADILEISQDEHSLRFVAVSPRCSHMKTGAPPVINAPP